MAPISQASFLLVSGAIARLASAGSIYAFPQAGCNTLGYYQTIAADTSSCSKTYLSDSDFTESPGNSGEYEAYFQVQSIDAGDNCAMVIGMDSSDAKAPPCGECVILAHTVGQCIQANLPTPFYAWECCGGDCDNQCAGTPAKRSTISEAVEYLQARKAEAQPARPDIANLKNRSPVTPLAKRADCSFTPTVSGGGLYSQAGDPTAVSQTYQPCQNSNGCSQMYSGMVESSFSQGFDVSESTEAGLFDIVSETVTFGYSATWESSKSVSVSGSYTYNEGQSGYMTFSPLSQCTEGTFSGADCAGMGIPTGGDARTACVPEVIAGGMPRGDINIVTTD